MADLYPDVTIRDFGAAGNPAGRVQPMEAHDLKAGKWILEPKTGGPCTAAEQPKKSKTGKHGSAKITCKLKYGFNNKTAQIMAPGHQQLEKALIEKLEYSFAYMEGNPEEEDLVQLFCMDDQNNEVELKLSKGRKAVWDKILGIIAEGEKNDTDVMIVVQEGPKRNKNAAQGYDIIQLVIDAKLVVDDKAE